MDIAMYGAVARIAGASHTFQPQPEARTVTYLTMATGSS